VVKVRRRPSSQSHEKALSQAESQGTYHDPFHPVWPVPDARVWGPIQIAGYFRFGENSTGKYSSDLHPFGFILLGTRIKGSLPLKHSVIVAITRSVLKRLGRVNSKLEISSLNRDERHNFRSRLAILFDRQHASVMGGSKLRKPHWLK
jgi:hypothetical protein